jgi:hypothetical protein
MKTLATPDVETQAKSAAPSKISTGNQALLSSAAVVSVLALIEALCFGPVMTHVGFYLDDWATLSFLHFAPKAGGYLGLLNYYLFNDSRVLIRPLEVLHYGTIYYLCGDKPFGYHLFNMILEVVASAQLYAILLRLTGKKAAAAVAALLLLLYPSHDSTRYWVICSSVNLTFVLYFASLNASIKACDAYLRGQIKKAWTSQTVSFACFFLSLLNYETLLPLAALNVLISAAIALRSEGSRNLKNVFKTAAFAALPVVASTVALAVYLKVIVPALGHGYAHAVAFSPKVMFDTVNTGLQISLPTAALPFFLEQAKFALGAFTSSEKVRLGLIVIAGAAAIGMLTRLDSGVKKVETTARVSGLLSALDLTVLGALTIFLSYTIFGLSPDYMPTYITLVNRVNSGASIGIAFIFAAAVLFITARTGKTLATILCSTGGALLIALFVLADWGLSKPWIVSWTTQKEVRAAVASLKPTIDPSASLLLISCPRYVMWSPVFDGVWDFQNMARITLDQPHFNANVVSERMAMTPEGIKDVSYGYDCGDYPFDKLYLMVAPHPELHKVSDAEQFAQIVEARGLSFGLDKKTLSKWREQSRSGLSPHAKHIK